MINSDDFMDSIGDNCSQQIANYHQIENYLEDSNILSLSIVNVIDKLLVASKDIVFGGSIALNAVGLIKRPIHDIDLMIHQTDKISLVKKFNSNNICRNYDDLSETVTDINGNSISRYGFKINDINICLFILPNVTSSDFVFNNRTIKIQNINEAILAKRAYGNINGISKEKHVKDLNSIDEFLNDLPY
jgi:hypothetical protein